MSETSLGLANLLIDHVREAGVVDLDELAREPIDALAADGSVNIEWVSPAGLPADCSIAASYDPTVVPALIRVAHDASPGRRRFSLLHEYGHHLRNQVLPVIQRLFQARRIAGDIEEMMCDHFASRVLVPEHVREAAFSHGVTARAVAELIQSSSASEQAVAVAAADSMTTSGYVMLLNANAETDFAARAGDVYPVRRGAQQTGLLARAAQGVVVRGVGRLDHGTGVQTGELNLESAVVDGRIVVVATDGGVTWKAFSGGRSSYAEANEHWCSECGTTFTTFAGPCAACGDHKCAECGRCGCVIRPMRGERACASCFVTKPPADFESDSADRCLDCTDA